MTYFQLGQVACLSKMLHAGQHYAGKDFFETHVRGVVKQVAYTYRNEPVELLEKLIQIAYLHDTIEDTQATSEALLILGVDPIVVEAVVQLTHCDYDAYASYILEIADHKLARMVKLCDLKCNLAQSIEDKHNGRYGFEARIARYKNAIDVLTSVD